MEMHRGRDEDEAEQMQCSSHEDGAVGRQNSGPVNEATVMHRCRGGQGRGDAEKRGRGGSRGDAGK